MRHDCHDMTFMIKFETNLKIYNIFVRGMYKYLDTFVNLCI